MIWLVSILRDDVLFRKLEADLESEYSRDLLDLFRGKLSWRKLISYVLELPPRCRFRLELATREHGEKVLWDEQLQLLTAIANNTASTARFTNASAASKVKNPKDLKPPNEMYIYPPGYQPEKKKFATAKEIAAFFGRLS